MDINKMLERAIRAARLDRTVFAELEADTSLTNEAIIFVAIIAVIQGAGGFLNSLVSGDGFLAAIGSLILGPIVAIIGFFIWAIVIFFVGTNLFKGQASDYTEVIRPLGYAYGPQVLGFFSFIPCLGGIASLVGTLWMAVAGFFAIRQALNQDDTNAILTIVVSIIIFFIVMLILGAILGIFGLAGAVGFGLLS